MLLILKWQEYSEEIVGIITVPDDFDIRAEYKDFVLGSDKDNWNFVSELLEKYERTYIPELSVSFDTVALENASKNFEGIYLDWTSFDDDCEPATLCLQED